MPVIQRALISTSNKTGIIDFARSLHKIGTQILATGGTASLLSQNQVPITTISDYTQFPEIMGGRVKTLHPKIYGGLLNRGHEDQALMREHQIQHIDLIAVNLYPFEEVSTDKTASLSDVIENIDIGGPSMIRAAAKNYQRVVVITDINDYSCVLDEINQQGNVSLDTREKLALKAFGLLARYNQAIANYFEQKNNQTSTFSTQLHLNAIKQKDLRYGENPHQRAAVYADPSQPEALASATPIQGKALSYNNLLDADCAVHCANSFAEPCCVIVKHASPCGVAIADNINVAYQRALAADTQSAFGGIIACNRTINLDTAQLITQGHYAEVVIAPAYDVDALAQFKSKPNLRILICSADTTDSAQTSYHSIQGGLLVQTQDIGNTDPSQYHIPTKKKATPNMISEAFYANKIVRFVKSNAIVLFKAGQSIGIGPGQPSRVKSTEIAIEKAQSMGFNCQNAIMASDAFFPFPDCITLAAQAGVTCIIQPGGSINDQSVIEACDLNDIAMIMTGQRHFRH